MPVFHKSLKRHELEDYLGIHALIDSTKMLCTDNRHRILHTFWGVQEVILRSLGIIFRTVQAKALKSKTSVKKTISSSTSITALFQRSLTLSAPHTGYSGPRKQPKRLEQFHADVIDDYKLSATLLSPLAVTGQLKSLLITHNSWFINSILPMMGKADAKFIEFDITPAMFFNPMRFELCGWTMALCSRRAHRNCGICKAL